MKVVCINNKYKRYNRKYRLTIGKVYEAKLTKTGRFLIKNNFDEIKRYNKALFEEVEILL